MIPRDPDPPAESDPGRRAPPQPDDRSRGDPGAQPPPGNARALAAALRDLASRDPPEAALARILQAAADRVAATSGALALRTPSGRRVERWVTVGMDDDARAALARRATADEDPAATAQSSLHVAVRARGAVVGDLYLLGKRTGAFTAVDLARAEALAAVVGLAVENARLVARAELHRTWLQAGTEIATALLSGADPVAVLHGVAERIAELADADLVGVLLPTADDDATLTIAAAVGGVASDFEGVRVPLTATHMGRVHRAGVATAIDDLGADPVVGEHAEVAVEITRGYGPGLMAPLTSSSPAGMIVAMRRRDRDPFDPDLLDPLGAFATQTSLALVMAGAQARERRLQVQADRDRIARDLHDQVVQQIFATALSLDRIAHTLESSHPEAAARIGRSVDELDDTIAEIRAVIFELHQDDDAAAAPVQRRLADLVRRVTEGHPVRPDVRARGPVDALPPDLAREVLAVVRELVTNVVRHAAASRLTVTLSTDDELRVVVTDNGVGLPAVAPRSGLANLADRAERRGGRLFTAGGPTGTQVRWVVPLSR